MARTRLNQNKKLPPYLYGTVSKGGTTYYSYRHPKTGKLHGMGTDEKAAVKAALQLNAQQTARTTYLYLLFNRLSRMQPVL